MNKKYFLIAFLIFNTINVFSSVDFSIKSNENQSVSMQIDALENSLEDNITIIQSELNEEDNDAKDSDQSLIRFNFMLEMRFTQTFVGSISSFQPNILEPPCVG